MFRNLRHKAINRLLWVVHRGPVHPGWDNPLRFAYGPDGCWLCHFVVGRSLKSLPPEAMDAFEDQSRVDLSEPELNEDGTVKKLGISMSAVAKRQFDEIVANDPAAREALEKMFEQIATEHAKRPN